MTSDALAEFFALLSMVIPDLCSTVGMLGAIISAATIILLGYMSVGVAGMV